MGFLSDMFGGAGKKAARENMRLIGDFETKGNNVINTADTAASGYLGQAGDLYKGIADLGKSNMGFYKDALGLNGEAGNAATMERFQAGPGYEFAMNQGLDALERRAGAQGRLQSGQTGLDTLGYAQGLANQEWGGYLDRLQGFDTQNTNLWTQGTAGQAGSLGSLADLAVGTGDRKLNLGSEVLNGRMGANNALATARNEGVSNFGSILSGGMKLLGGYM